IYFHSFSVMSDLAIGGLSAWTVFNFSKFRNRLTSLPNYFIAAILLLGILFCVFIENRPNEIMYAIFYRLITASFFAFIILEQNFAKNSPFKLGKLKLFSRWGKITYGLYILHPTVIYFLDFFKVKYFNTANAWINFSYTIITFSFCIAVCTFSYKYYEQPFLRLKAKFSR
ncbi:MAG: hypothetical protein LH629_10895, partial [Ignavibacteria bacterium]|nr:hypothetical protein [Ignavibacteria bacterium]